MANYILVPKTPSNLTVRYRIEMERKRGKRVTWNFLWDTDDLEHARAVAKEMSGKAKIRIVDRHKGKFIKSKARIPGEDV